MYYRSGKRGCQEKPAGSAYFHHLGEGVGDGLGFLGNELDGPGERPMRRLRTHDLASINTA